jgi:hypothetical protein
MNEKKNFIFLLKQILQYQKSSIGATTGLMPLCVAAGTAFLITEKPYGSEMRWYSDCISG